MNGGWNEREWLLCFVCSDISTHAYIQYVRTHTHTDVCLCVYEIEAPATRLYDIAT